MFMTKIQLILSILNEKPKEGNFAPFPMWNRVKTEKAIKILQTMPKKM